MAEEKSEKEDTVVKLKGEHVLKHVIDTEQKVDTRLAMKDGIVGAHRIVLVAISPFLEKLFLQQAEDTRTITVILPDITKKTMETLLNLAYTGQLTYLEDEADDVLSAMETLQFGEYIQLTMKRVKKDKYPEETENPVLASNENECVEVKDVSNEGKATEPLNDIRPECKICHLSFQSEAKLVIHNQIEHDDDDVLEEPTSKDLNKITYCLKCNTQYNTLTEISKCLRKHGVSRCSICLDVFPQQKLAAHIRTHDGTVGNRVKCRWCPKHINISGPCGTYALLVHCKTAHFDQNGNSLKAKPPSGIPSISTRSKRLLKRYVEEETSSDNYICSQPTKRRKYFDYSLSTYRPGTLPSFFTGFNDNTGKVMLDLSKLPKIHIPLREIPEDILAIYNSKSKSGEGTATKNIIIKEEEGPSSSSSSGSQKQQETTQSIKQPENLTQLEEKNEKLEEIFSEEQLESDRTERSLKLHQVINHITSLAVVTSDLPVITESNLELNLI